MRALVTGISGFVGGFLSKHLYSNGWVVTGFDHRISDHNNSTYLGDILDQSSLSKAISTSQPDVIFHLAGVIKSASPQDYFNANVLGTLSLFESIIKSEVKSRVVIASSSAVYGSGSRNRPISENFAIRPRTDYAASKAAQEIVARRFYLAYNIPVIILRTFNLTGPGQPLTLACSSFARQIAFDENQPETKPIKTGNLNSKRDFIDVRDAAKAYELVSTKGIPGSTYNVCSGQSVSIQHCLNLLLGMASRSLQTETDQKKLQKNDIPVQLGNFERIYRATGWKAQISLENSLFDLLNYWRQRLSSTME